MHHYVDKYFFYSDTIYKSYSVFTDAKITVAVAASCIQSFGQTKNIQELCIFSEDSCLNRPPTRIPTAVIIGSAHFY